MCIGFLWEKTISKKDHLEDLGVDDRTRECGLD